MRRFEVPMGYIQFDDKEIEYAFKLEPESVSSKISLKLAKLSSLGIGSPIDSASKKIRLDAVTSVQLTWLASAESRPTLMAKLASLPIGTLRINTAGGGGTPAIKINIMDGQRADAETFVDGLNEAISNFARNPSSTKADSGPVKTCPDCAEDVKEAANKCRFCGHLFT